jgi:hypothetical protein
LLYVDPPRPVVWLYVVGLNLAYIVLSVHIPISVYPGAPHDDGLYMVVGRFLAEGFWLGPFGQYTLMKGPGYPAFLALANWLGISVTLAHALFHCFSITFFVLVCHRFVRSAVLSGLMLALLLFQPVTLTEPLRRVFREEIYYGQLLLILGLVITMLFLARNSAQRLICGALSGLALGWFWLTREEGFWILPALIALFAFMLLRSFRYWHLRQIAVAVSVMIATFAMTQIGYMTLNWRYYGRFVGVDFKEANFQKALGAIHSVRSGGIKPYVPVTFSARQHIYRVSPTFASLQSYFDLPDRTAPSGWTEMTCNMVPDACGEIAAGWFMWGLRDAAALRGHYASPARASAFFGQIAFEITSACQRGELECKPQLVAEMPPVIWSDVMGRLWVGFVRAFDLITAKQLPLYLHDSAGTERQLADALRFLNTPYHVPPKQDMTPYSIKGWFHKAGDEWFSVVAKNVEGLPQDMDFDRLASEELKAITKDPAANNQRFRLNLRCDDACVLTFTTRDGTQLAKSLGELLKQGLFGYRVSGSLLVIESIDKLGSPFASETRIERVSGRIRTALVSYYYFVYLPLLALGVLAFLAATVIHPRQAAFKISYQLAFVCWSLLFLRVIVLSLIEATSFPALQIFYIAPAYFVAIAAAVLSIVALLDLSGFATLPVKTKKAFLSNTIKR